MTTKIKNGQMKTIPNGLSSYGFIASNQPQCAIVNITPIMAEEWLHKNTKNRTFSKKNVTNIVHNIKSGNWKLTNDAICFDSEGVLVNGQHRLKSCVFSQMPIIAIVATNMPVDSFVIMDTGKKRSLGDSLGIDGVDNSKKVASASLFILSFKGGKYKDASTSLSRNIIRPEAHSFALENDLLHECVRFSLKHYKASSERLVPMHFMSGLTYILTEQGKGEEARDFFTKACSGFGFTQSSPIALLLKILRKDRLSNTGKISSRHKLALIVKALNAFIRNESPKQFRFASDAKFPTLK